MEITENYVYKKEVDWSLLHDGLALPLDNQVVFSYNMGRFLKRGESKKITMYLNNKGYDASVRNLNFNPKFKRIKDTLQIRYPRNGVLSQALQLHFSKSYNYIKTLRELRPKEDRSMIKLPDDYKEYLAIYTTEYDNAFLLETIKVEDMNLLKDVAKNQSERVMENNFNYDIEDIGSTIFSDDRIVKIRKLNRKIGENLKLLYGYRCQVCGELTGERYDAHVVEAHHIDYYINSLNNNANNLLILCPNHHSIIHDVNPVFDRKKLIYLYPNSIQEGLKINKHLDIC